MPLTPADVHNVAFKKPSIGKRGYDEDEVDAFLDVVEAELEPAHRGERRPDVAAGRARGRRHAAGAAPRGRGSCRRRRPRLPRRAAQRPATAMSRPPGCSGLAQETADRLTEEAKAESEKMLADAKSQSEALITDATTRAEAAERDSRISAEALDKEAQSKYDEVLGKLADERVGLEKKIEDLRSLRAGVPRPAEELDQRAAGAARRRKRPRSRQASTVLNNPSE